jgi:phosphate:Na+ symporter
MTLRVGDHAINILELSERKFDQKLTFTPIAFDELRRVLDLMSSMFENTIGALRKQDVVLAGRVIENEGKLNEIEIELKENHIQRLNEGTCYVLSGIVFIDLVDNIERIGDHLTNIAQGVLRHLRWDMDIGEPLDEED